MHSRHVGIEPTALPIARQVKRPCIAAFFLMLVGFPVFGCTVIEPDWPALGDVVAYPAPQISWPALPETDSYRIQIQSRTPEGRVLHTLDQLTPAPRFRPATALTDTQAAVKVLVSAGCDSFDLQDLAARPARFFIDTSLECPSPTTLSLDATPSATVVSWSAVPQAITYEVHRRGIADTRIVERTTTRESSLRLTGSADDAVILLRPVCKLGKGAWLTVPQSGAHRQGGEDVP